MPGQARESFDKAAEQFSQDYYSSLRGFVREQLIRQNLAPLLGDSLRVVDIGGGEGKDAIWLARQGHEVVLVDPSAEQLSLAEKNFANENDTVQQRLSFLKGAEAEAFQKYGQGSFDLVLSHGVLMYQLGQSKSQEHVTALFDLAKPLGKVSLVTTGYAGALAGLIDDKNIAGLKKLRETGRYKNHLSIEVNAYDEDQTIEFIEKAGGRILEWYGIRIASNTSKLRLADVDEQVRRKILELETELGSSASTKGMGKLLHFLAAKQ